MPGGGNVGAEIALEPPDRVIGAWEHPIGQKCVPLAGGQLIGLLHDLARLESEEWLADHGMAGPSNRIGRGEAGSGASRLAS